MGPTCELIDCSQMSFPRPASDTCFTFFTGDFGGFQVSNSGGCQVTFDGEPQSPNAFGTVNSGNVGFGDHSLLFENCTNPVISWSCWQ
jgi:hypothetical protein